MQFTAKIGTDRTALTYTVTVYGKDILVHINGGTSHLGSITSAGSGIHQTTVFPGHKEQFLTEPLAEAISTELHCSCCVTAGVHIDDITKGEIELILNQHNDFIPVLIQKIRENADNEN